MLFITRCVSTLISDVDFGIHPFTDHYSIHSVMNVPRFNQSPTIKKQIRAIKSIDPAAFSTDIRASPLYSDPLSDLQSYSTLFSTTLSSLLDKHAPLKTISCTSRPNKLFITPEILREKTKRSKLESIYRRCKTKQNKVNFKNQSKLVAKLVTASKQSLYRSQINQHSNNPKKLWPIMNSLLSRTLPQSLPAFSSASNLTTSFLNFFTYKITKLSASFPSVTLIWPHCLPPVPPSAFTFMQTTHNYTS